jgi:Family of unknown function (DUF6314)
VDTLAFLVGGWRVTRSIVDHRNGTRGTFAGTVRIGQPLTTRRDGDERRARYDESGELHFGDYSGFARRCLDYAPRRDTTVMIYFADGRPFVDLDLRSGEWRSIHHCGEDLHEITSLVVSGDVMQEHWRVQGPMTNYEASTTLMRTSSRRQLQ